MNILKIFKESLDNMDQNSMQPLINENLGEVYFLAKNDIQSVERFVKEGVPEMIKATIKSKVENKDLRLSIDFLSYPYSFECVLNAKNLEKQKIIAEKLLEQNIIKVISVVEDKKEQREVLFIKAFSYTNFAAKLDLMKLV